jgi:transcriptional regulator with PAS, ATPase and Fis domain
VDLKSAVDAGHFRSDLFYRLNVHRVHLPPLRERAEDLRQLVTHFLARDGAQGGVTDCSPEAWDALLAYRYPGNVRQLEHIVQRAVAVARGSVVAFDDLPEELIAPAPAAPPAAEGTVAAARERAEREMLVTTLARHAGEISAAARELQVSRTTMWRLMKKYGIPAAAG